MSSWKRHWLEIIIDTVNHLILDDPKSNYNSGENNNEAVDLR